MAKEIPLAKGSIATVDDADYEYLNQQNWYVHSEGCAVRYKRVFCEHKERHIRKAIWMHREIIQVPDGMLPDHINGNPLDNRRKNLRIVTPAQNTWNTKKAAGTSSQYKGVSWHKKKQRWQSQLMVKGKMFSLGCFKCEHEAGKAYVDAKEFYHGKHGKKFFVDLLSSEK